MKFSFWRSTGGHDKQKACKINTYTLLLMPQTGVEPALTCVNSDLNAARLPIPPLRQQFITYLSYQKVNKVGKVNNKKY